MHPSTIARLETASLDPKLSVVRRPLAMVGLSLDLVVDDSIWTEDQSLEVDKCGLLDGAGRRWPAHLDEVYYATWQPTQRLWRYLIDRHTHDIPPWSYRRNIDPGGA